MANMSRRFGPRLSRVSRFGGGELKRLEAHLSGFERRKQTPTLEALRKHDIRPESLGGAAGQLPRLTA